MNNVLKGDFLGFTFNGHHSSEYGIFRTSDGSRFNLNLLPTSQEVTDSVPGRDETYYWTTNYTQKSFNLSIAFDELSELQIRKLRQWLSLKTVATFSLDETPYKEYMVKCTGTPQLKYICFDGSDGRVYKGEGTLNFIAYYPYAKSKYKYIKDFEDNYSSFPAWEGFETNIEEWRESCGMLYNKTALSTSTSTITLDEVNTDSTINLYNAGDLPTNLIIDLSLPSSALTTDVKIELQGSTVMTLSLSLPTTTEGDTGIWINTRTHLIEGYRIVGTEKKASHNLYNKYIVSGDFFQLPVSTESAATVLEVQGLTLNGVEYNYLYY